MRERAWGTVREDYSEHGTAWDSFSHDDARSRTYRWNEDGLGGISDRHQHLCLAVALWNGSDPILKERLFGLAGSEGNHGEDVKELYFYLDGTPTHSFLEMRYLYPHGRFPSERLVAENAQRRSDEPEVDISYAKAAVNDVLGRVAVTNRGPEAADCWVLPTLWFRNKYVELGVRERPDG